MSLFTRSLVTLSTLAAIHISRIGTVLYGLMVMSEIYAPVRLVEDNVQIVALK